MMTIGKPSLLFIPALKDHFWKKIHLLADRIGGVIIDLEDAILQSHKAKAREKVLYYSDLLRTLRAKHRHLRVIIRVNNIGTKFYKADMELVKRLISESLIDSVLYSKPEDPQEINQLSEDINTEQVFIFAAIETLAGYQRYAEILNPDKGVKWAIIGAEDLCADMDIERPIVYYCNPLLNQIAINIALHAKVKGIHFWGNIWPYLSKNELLPYLRREITTDYMMGAVGKVIFHPYQVDFVEEVFNRKHEYEVKKRTMAEKLSELVKRSEKEGLSVGVFNGRMIGTPELVRLQRWLQHIEDEKLKSDIIASIPNLALFQQTDD